jgi:Rieske Fe-S protein
MHREDSADCQVDCPLLTSRRTFISQTVLAAAAAALAACAGGGGDVTAPASVGSSIKVADYPALAATGGVALVTVGGARLAIVRTDATSFVALSRVCPHEGGTISPSSTGFLCAQHGAQFNATGTWVGGQRTSSMRSYPAVYDAATGTLAIG